MFKRSEFISEPFSITRYDHRHKLVYVMDNKEQDCRYLKSLLDKNNCEYIIHWQSKFDRNHIEITQPKIYDAFNCVITAFGTLFNLNTAVSCFQLRNDRVEFLEKCFKDNEEKEICIAPLESQNINYAELANLIIASLSHQQ